MQNDFNHDLNNDRNVHIRRVNTLSAELDALYHRAAWKLSMSDSAFDVLYALHENGGSCAIHEICRQTGCCKQTINSALRKLENSGVVYLEPMAGKGKRVCLTDAGRSYMDETVARFCTAETAATQSWPMEEIRRFADLMEKYVNDLQQQMDQMPSIQ